MRSAGISLCVWLMAGDKHTRLQRTAQDVRRHTGNEPGARASGVPTSNGALLPSVTCTVSGTACLVCGAGSV